MLTKAALRSIFPKAPDVDLEAFISSGIEALKDAGILEMANRLQYFLAQLGHESNGLTHKEENLNYSAKRLTEIWPSRFPTLDSAKPFAFNPEKLANKVYGGRMGNTEPGDGYRYRGRGYIQLTGRETYTITGSFKVTFPQVTQWVQVQNLDNSKNLRIGFSDNGVNNSHYYLLRGGTTAPATAAYTAAG